MSSAPPVLTLSGCLLGARIVLPSLPGLVAFAIAFGAASVQKGMTVWESLAASFFVGGVAGALGFKHAGYASTVPLALVLVALACVPALDDLGRLTRPRATH